MLFNILRYSQINIWLWTDFIFTDHLSIWLVNYRSFIAVYLIFWEQPSYSYWHTLTWVNLNMMVCQMIEAAPFSQFLISILDNGYFVLITTNSQINAN